MMDIKQIQNQTEAIFNTMDKLSPHEASKDAVISATAQIMQAIIIADKLNRIADRLVMVG